MPELFVSFLIEPLEFLAFSLAELRDANTIVASTPMIATATRSSIKVNPRFARRESALG